MPMKSANQATSTHIILGTITDNTYYHHIHILLQDNNNIFVVVVIIVNTVLVTLILSINLVNNINNWKSRAPTSSDGRLFEPLDFVVCALQALRPCDHTLVIG